jgi:hypothetical protein
LAPDPLFIETEKLVPEGKQTVEFEGLETIEVGDQVTPLRE